MVSGAPDIRPPLGEFNYERGSAPVTVLSGGNNTGKSLVLKWLKASIGPSAYMVGANRFYHVYQLATSMRDPNELGQLEQQFSTNFSQPQYNHEQNFLDLNRIIVGLSDNQRDRLFEICAELLDTTFTLAKFDPDNELSFRYIEMGGRNLSVGSTGARLLLTLMGILMDDRFNTILIDEPELGLSPRVQSAVASFLYDSERRRQYFPHLHRIIVATHSHLFLDRAEVQNNFVVMKDEGFIRVDKIATISDFHRLQFNLLGNTLEAMFLPAAIIVVEGATDKDYIEHLTRIYFPAQKITVLSGQGDVKRRIYGLSEAFGALDSSPFRGRIFVVLDSVHNRGLRTELVAMGVPHDNVVVWSGNGIEYVYPPSVLASVFMCDAERVQDMTIDGDVVALNGITRKKRELAREVIPQVDRLTRLPDELSDFVEAVERAVT